jgi:hypothetical protein
MIERFLDLGKHVLKTQGVGVVVCLAVIGGLGYNALLDRQDRDRNRLIDLARIARLEVRVSECMDARVKDIKELKASN